MGVLSNNYAQIVPGALISASYVSDIYNVLMGDEPESIILSGSLTISGSTISTLGFTGSLHGTSSWAVSSSRATLATTASYAISASYINYINSSSIADLALTASYINTAQTASYYGGSVISSSYSITASYVAPKPIAINTQTGSSYIISSSDLYNLIAMSSSISNTVIIPNDTELNTPIGSNLLITSDGIGQTTITGSTGVSILSNNSKLKLTGQYSFASLIKRSENIWSLTGDITSW